MWNEHTAALLWVTHSVDIASAFGVVGHTYVCAIVVGYTWFTYFFLSHEIYIGTIRHSELLLHG